MTLIKNKKIVFKHNVKKTDTLNSSKNIKCKLKGRYNYRNNAINQIVFDY